MTVINTAERQKNEKYFLKEIIKNLSKGVHKYHFYVIDTAPIIVCEEPLVYLDPEPFRGKIIAYNKAYMLIKFGLNQFRAVALKYATAKPAVGTKVDVIPYMRVNYSGRYVTRIIKKIAEGDVDKLKQLSIDRRAQLPILIPSLKTSSMQTMIKIFNRSFHPEISYRTISEILLDANPSEFSFNNPSKAELNETLPEIRVKVSTQKLDGYVILSCQSSGKRFNLKTITEKMVVNNKPNLRSGELIKLLIEWIDDRNWQKTIVNIVGQ